MAKSASNPKAKESESSSLPLFFKRPVPLDQKRHAKSTLLPTQDLSFAATTNSIVINAIEFFEAAKQYPIVFTQGDSPLPAAIVGLEQKNYFVNKGQWKEGTYLPAYVRKYPFVFMDVPERNQFVLCVDEAASQFKENGGGKEALPLYKDGNPSDLTRNALEFCTAYHNHHQLTRRFCEDIKKADLLTPTRSDAKLYSGREIHLSGFQAIDEKKLNALPDETVLEFFKKGWLPLIYAVLMSSANWKKLVDMAGEQEKIKAN